VEDMCQTNKPIKTVENESLRNLPKETAWVKGDIVHGYTKLMDSFVAKVDSLERVSILQINLLEKLREIKEIKLD
jgi:hypothetical protein